MGGELKYDRRVSEPFLSHFRPKGLAASLVEYAKNARLPVDLQFRRTWKSGSEHATLYVGLTAVLNVHSANNGDLRLSAHRAWTDGGYGYRDQWSSARVPADWIEDWRSVEGYLERVIPAAAERFGAKEGGVQAAVSSFRSRTQVMLDREVTPSFRDTATKANILTSCRAPLLEALHNADLPYGKVPKSLGAECDLLAVDARGRLLAVEVKPLSGGNIAWVPAQAAMYARVLQRWVDTDSEHTRVIEGMLAQRQAVRLAPKFDLALPAKPYVVPVVALQRGASAEKITRMQRVRGLIDQVNEQDGIPPLEIYEVSLSGRLDPLEPADA